MISNNFIKAKKLDPELSKGKIVDLNEKNYYEEVIPVYKIVAKMLNKDETNISALNLFMENLNIIKHSYDKVSLSELFKYFYKSTYVNNINNILDEEKKYLEKKIEEVKKIINDLSVQNNIRKTKEFDL